ncbi:unnamed protein product [Rotaria socialis]|uniref:Uncharacterized protein n=1 Tax=Rotaria socialis TaxID=392032 RepID=A0A821G2Z1_9BILA|nr:unnamed protein product [Rotaria socialis]CAF4658099.1 unnamed protein product [Rotaria socialis]
MSYLENFTLYLRIKGQNRIIDGACVQNDTLVYMPQPHSFTFYITTSSIGTRDLSRADIEQTLTNSGLKNASSLVNNISPNKVAYSIFSLSFEFDYLVDLCNILPNIVFSYVTYLVVKDDDAFRHDFFVRIA